MLHKVGIHILIDREATWAASKSRRPVLTEDTWLTTQNAWVRESMWSY